MRKRIAEAVSVGDMAAVEVAAAVVVDAVEDFAADHGN